MGESKNSVSVDLPSRWEQLFEAALLEDNPALIAQRLRDAKDAVMDRIEDSFDSAFSLSERQSLLAALNVIGDLHRLSGANDNQRRVILRRSGHAA
jgi:hypothetical protein